MGLTPLGLPIFIISFLFGQDGLRPLFGEFLPYVFCNQRELSMRLKNFLLGSEERSCWLHTAPVSRIGRLKRLLPSRMHEQGSDRGLKLF
jgi:hypothetical protein